MRAALRRLRVVPFAVSVTTVWVNSAAADDSKTLTLRAPVVAAESSIFGFRAGATGVRAPGERPNAAAVTANIRREGYGQEKDIGVRVLNFFALGGGSEGVEGALGMSIAGSYRAPVTENEGPFARMGISAAATATPLTYYSYLELPELGFGYQYFAGHALLEAGLKTGYVLTGFHRADNAVRPLGASFEWGGFAAMHLTPIHLTAGLTRYLSGAPASSLDVFEGVLCSGGRYLAVCTDVRFALGDVNERSTGEPHGARAMSVGLTIGTPEPRK